MSIKTNIGDAASISAVAAIFIGYLPQITAVVSLVWLGLRVYEMWVSVQIKRMERDEKRRQLREQGDAGHV